MNVPAGFVEEEKSKLPIGVQLVGKPFDDQYYLESLMLMIGTVVF